MPIVGDRQWDRRSEESAADVVAIRDLLGLGYHEARDIARGVAIGRRSVCGGRFARLTTRRNRRWHCAIRDSIVCNAFEDAPDPVLLSVPVMGATVLAIAELAHVTRRQLFIEATPLTELLLKPLLPRQAVDRSPQLLLPGSLLRQLKSGTRNNLPPSTFITFPDHHAAPDDCCQPVRFFGEDHALPLLEPLLHRRGASPLVTLVATGDGDSRNWSLASYADAASSPPSMSELRSQELLDWLAVRVEAVMRSMPDDVMSWRLARERSYRVRRQHRSHEIRIVEGFLRSWRSRDPAVDRSALDWALAELDRLGDRRPAGASAHPGRTGG